MIIILSKICVDVHLPQCQHILNTHHLKHKKGNMLVFMQRCRWIEVCKEQNMSCVLLILNIVPDDSFKWMQNQHTKNFLTFACCYRSRPKAFSTQHNITLCKKNFVCKNLTVAGKTRTLVTYFIAFYFLLL